jgi:hypothetical protein
MDVIVIPAEEKHFKKPIELIRIINSNLNSIKKNFL